MDVHHEFQRFVSAEQLFAPDMRILLAVSGGMDSMLMLYLFASSGVEFGVAHCNFALRGSASDADEQLVRTAAQRLDAPFHVRTFDTEGYARTHGVSIQMAARDLRYAWLEEVREAEGYDYVAVAHHLNDSLETALLNWARGTGLAGMRGIVAKRDRIVRPLLFATRAQVENTVKRLGIVYRDDESNRSTKYARNKIRLEIIPLLKQLNPDLERTFAENTFFFSESLDVVQQQTERLRAKLLDAYLPGRFRIARQAIAELAPQRLLLVELLRPFGFPARTIQDLLRMADTVSGKQFTSDEYTLYVDREYVFIHPRLDQESAQEVLIKTLGVPVRWGQYEFLADCSSDRAIGRECNTAKFDADTVRMPLRVRSWKLADAFQPLGMKGTKKISDYFVSLKIPVFEKVEIPIVTTADDHIAWVAPYRMDNRFKITDKTKKVITLTCRRLT